MPCAESPPQAERGGTATGPTEACPTRHRQASVDYFSRLAPSGCVRQRSMEHGAVGFSDGHWTSKAGRSNHMFRRSTWPRLRCCRLGRRPRCVPHCPATAVSRPTAILGQFALFFPPKPRCLRQPNTGLQRPVGALARAPPKTSDNLNLEAICADIA